ncbi:MAG: SsrA-binding protein [Candidatus Kerfeldbacteria bacterium RIFCSPHIGHO2_12_FULL_48_17]|uniref:SsrA-binding protein n=1 Tax=Candidatus Kerfeldbacteria bacterium RIFCSPHIGHO2_12_FULL_48_17 TaxID=1798542 RepID=A0A1G2B5S9_9BACT|nr:MAG: SsrA-binding protein [Candidatus Kerfeldbacteria bacterium RIFCSPHIGHO2_12_FULL_48_17]
MPQLVFNKQGLFNYTVTESFEAGIKLLGSEVKSIKLGHINLKGSYVSLKDGAAWLMQAHVSAYEPSKGKPGSLFAAKRPRKLLLSQKELDWLQGKLSGANLTIIPVKLYTKGAFIKVEIALARSKKQHDKREIIKKREIDRSIRRSLKGRNFSDS